MKNVKYENRNEKKLRKSMHRQFAYSINNRFLHKQFIRRIFQFTFIHTQITAIQPIAIEWFCYNKSKE